MVQASFMRSAGSAPRRTLQLELELEQARHHGRWLSDDERDALAEQERRQEAALQQQRVQRRKLLILLAVCVVVPPLWPLALALLLYLLFPLTSSRLAVATGLSLLVMGGLLAALTVALVVALLMLIF